MADMNRRNFLFGTVATAATAAGIFLQAPPEAVELFKPSLAETLAITRISKQASEQPGGTTCTLRFPDGFTMEFEVVEIVAPALQRTLEEVSLFSDNQSRYVLPGTVRRAPVTVAMIPTGGMTITEVLR